MNKSTLQGMWEAVRLHAGVSLRAVAKIPADKLDSNPIPNMRTPKELAIHSFAYLRGIPGAVVKGKLTADDVPEPMDQINSVDDLVAWCRESFEIANSNFEKVTDEQLNAMVDTHFGKPFPGWMLFTIAYDEHIHHRGQLYTYLREMGIEPPFIWSFDENEAAFQPKAATV
jgi:uncharacterized damage-inducible protein DinB